MALIAKDAHIAVRVHSATKERLEDIADAEGVELSDLLRTILTNASYYRIKKLRREGKAPPARAYNKRGPDYDRTL